VVLSLNSWYIVILKEQQTIALTQFVV
jgi:hypothetical protein